MASRFWTYVNNLVAGQTARADDVRTSFEGVDGGLANVEGEMNRAFRFTNGTPSKADFEIADAPAARARKAVGFNSAGDPSLINTTFIWRGDWGSGTSYTANDVVRGPTYDSIYLANVTHVSSGSFAADASKWTVMIDLEGVTKSVITHKIINSNYQAVAGDDLMVDLSASSITITLPANPVITDQPINIMDAAGALGGTEVLTIERNGKPIMGLAENMTVTTKNASFGLAYCNSTYGWRIRGV